MKKLLLFLAFVSLVEFVKAQQYVPFPDSNAIWRVEYTQYQVLPPFDYQYTIKGDTIIHNLNYKIINCSGVNNNFTFFNCNIGALRQDTVSRKIYFIAFSGSCFPVPFLATGDSLLYDFSLNIGDTLHNQFNLPYYYMNLKLYIEDIDSVLLGNTYHKRFILGVVGGTHNPAYLIEGIGSTNGLLEPIDNLYMDADYSLLICFSLNDTSLYPSYSPSACPIITNINDVNELKNKLNIFPNPSSDNIIIESPPQSTIEISNIEGQLIKTLAASGTKTNIDHVGWSSYVVDISALPCGVYVVQVKTEKGVAVKKFIKE